MTIIWYALLITLISGSLPILQRHFFTKFDRYTMMFASTVCATLITSLILWQQNLVSVNSITKVLQESSTNEKILFVVGIAGFISIINIIYAFCIGHEDLKSRSSLVYFNMLLATSLLVTIIGSSFTSTESLKTNDYLGAGLVLLGLCIAS